MFHKSFPISKNHKRIFKNCTVEVQFAPYDLSEPNFLWRRIVQRYRKIGSD